MRSAIWYLSYNLKNVKNTYRGVLLLVKLQASATLLKVTLLNGCFSRFFNCAHGTKLRNAPNIMNELFKGKILTVKSIRGAVV